MRCGSVTATEVSLQPFEVRPSYLTESWANLSRENYQRPDRLVHNGVRVRGIDRSCGDTMNKACLLSQDLSDRVSERVPIWQFSRP